MEIISQRRSTAWGTLEACCGLRLWHFCAFSHVFAFPHCFTLETELPLELSSPREQPHFGRCQLTEQPVLGHPGQVWGSRLNAEKVTKRLLHQCISVFFTSPSPQQAYLGETRNAFHDSLLKTCPINSISAKPSQVCLSEHIWSFG